MQTADLLKLIKLGEGSQHQFKSNVTRSDALAQEMVAFSNSHGFSKQSKYLDNSINLVLN